MPEEESTEQVVRGLRSKEQWLRYDSIVIGPGATKVDPGWFENFADFAAAERIVFNSGQRSRSVGRAYTNQQSEREDFAQDIYQSGVEWIAPPGILEAETQAFDALVGPLMWTREIPNRTSFRFVIADTDTVAIMPGIHAPASVGATGQAPDDSSSNVTIPGQTGNVDLRSAWSWPEPVKVPAKGQWYVEMILDQPWKACLQHLTNTPGFKNICQGPGAAVQVQEEPECVLCPNWYVIRVWHRGPRYVQLRGARSS